MNFQVFYGLTELSSEREQEKLLTTWYMERKLFCRQKMVKKTFGQLIIAQTMIRCELWT